MAKVEAQWYVTLDCVCPHCQEYVDLLGYPDFWDGRELDIPESGTPRSTDMEVTCPECSNEFTVDCVW